MPRRAGALLALTAAVLLATAGAPARAAGPVPVAAARDVEPVVLTGASLPEWSRLAAVGQPKPYPSGALDGVRDAHNGTIVVPPDVRTGAPVHEIAAARWDGTRFVEVPVQVDERFPFFLANGRSSFSPYSGTDEELTYAWDSERWKMTAGTCTEAYPPGQGPVADPVPGLDDDDEVALVGGDAGGRAPADAKGLPGSGPQRYEVALSDPTDPGATRWIYLFRRPSGSSFTAANGYVHYQRDANADQWIDKGSFRDDDPEKLGTSNRDYGPNIPGAVCDPNGATRQSTDRFPRDGVTVSTGSYRWHASGRWMVRAMQVAKPGHPAAYGPDLVDRWKGRAFQRGPDGARTIGGFEDEQVNWEANSSLLGERQGPVRAIREVWGADSGTNVTKTETFWPDAVTYRFHLRVHPIPPDGLYTSWDYNHGVASRYYTVLRPDGVPIDGVNDDVGNLDKLDPVPATFDAPDPTFDVPLAFSKWEQVSGRDDTGSLVYLFELLGPSSATEPLVAPYYSDDKCFDDGTGDDPVPRPFPGEATDDPRVEAAYGSGGCETRQGDWGAHGIHFLATSDTDNATTGKPITEVDGRQWQFAVPTEAPHAVGEAYANDVRVPLVPLARLVPNAAAGAAATSAPASRSSRATAAAASGPAGTLPATGGTASTAVPAGVLLALGLALRAQARRRTRRCPGDGRDLAVPDLRDRRHRRGLPRVP